MVGALLQLGSAVPAGATSQLSLSPQSASPSTPFSATFSFDPSPYTCDYFFGNTTVTFTWDNATTLAQGVKFQSPATCVATANVAVPGSAAPGSHTVTATASTTARQPASPSASAKFTVLATTTTVPPASTTTTTGTTPTTTTGRSTTTVAGTTTTVAGTTTTAVPAGPAPVTNLALPPVAFTGPPAAGHALTAVRFTAGPIGPQERYQWYFEPGAAPLSCPASDPVALHRFTSPGTYDVAVQVAGPTGTGPVTTRTVTVGSSVRSVGSFRPVRSAMAAGGCARLVGDLACTDQLQFDGARAVAVDGCFVEPPRTVAAGSHATAVAGALSGAPGGASLVTTTAAVTGAAGTTSGSPGAPAPAAQVVEGGTPPPVTAFSPARADTARCTTTACPVSVAHTVVPSALVRPVDGSGVWVCTCTVSVDGLEIAPGSGADGPGEVVVDELDDQLYAPDATVQVAGSTTAGGGHPVTLARHRMINRILPDASTKPGGVVELGSFPGVGAYLPSVFGFSLVGTARAYLVGDQLQVKATVSLPDILAADPSGDPITGTVTLVADGSSGLHLQDLAIEVPDAYLGAVELQHVHMSYDANGDVWDAGGSLYLVGEAAVTGDIGFRHGSFDHGSASLDIANPGIGIVPPILYLNHIAFSVAAGPPPVFTGDIVLTGGGEFSTPSGDAAAVTLHGSLTFTDADPWSIDATGDATVVGIDLATASLHFDSSGALSFNGHVHADLFNLGVVTVDAQVGGAVYSDGSFDVDNSVNACVLWGAACAGGEVVISSLGFGACLALSGPFGTHLHIGGGYSWGGAVDIMWDSCGVGPWQVGPPPQQAAPAGRTLGGGPVLAAMPIAPEALGPAGAYRLQFPAGVPFEMVGVTGGGAPPDVVVTAPDGTSFTTTPGPPHVQGDALVITSPHDDTTYIAIVRPSAGSWTVAPAGSSAPFTQVRAAAGRPDPQVSATVTRAGGGRRALHWRVVPQPGMRVRFVEQGAGADAVIGTANGTSGTILFTPADGLAGRRTIVAEVSQDGLPRTTVELATYQAPGRRLPARPSGLSAARSGGVLSLRWGPVALAHGYAVRAVLPDGRRLLLVEPASHRAATVTGLYPVDGGRVEVRAVLADGTPGPAAVLDVPVVRSGSGGGDTALVVGLAAAGAGLLAAAAAILVRRRRTAA